MFCFQAMDGFSGSKQRMDEALQLSDTVFPFSFFNLSAPSENIPRHRLMPQICSNNSKFKNYETIAADNNWHSHRCLSSGTTGIPKYKDLSFKMNFPVKQGRIILNG
jgi:hypothetical protein